MNAERQSPRKVNKGCVFLIHVDAILIFHCFTIHCSIVPWLGCAIVRFYTRWYCTIV